MVYGWTPDGVYTYRFHVNGTLETTWVYNGPPPCVEAPWCAKVEAGGLFVISHRRAKAASC